MLLLLYECLLVPFLIFLYFFNVFCTSFHSTALIKVTKDLSLAKCKGWFLPLTWLFSSIWDKLSLLTPSSLGFRWTSCSWFSSYLTSYLFKSPPSSSLPLDTGMHPILTLGPLPCMHSLPRWFLLLQDLKHHFHADDFKISASKSRPLCLAPSWFITA